ncbi:MAG: T9SS type A sorting domain-containing protein, partial [Flavobacteriales bacterium]|nr:T9SS type A sorting domain-containing protein [Flavobacteriales bacterium]
LNDTLTAHGNLRNMANSPVFGSSRWTGTDWNDHDWSWVSAETNESTYIVYGMGEMAGTQFAWGDLNSIPSWSTIGSNFGTVNVYGEMMLIDPVFPLSSGRVYNAIEFEDRIYICGDFASLDNQIWALASTSDFHTSVDEIDENGVSLFPNPSNGLFTLTMPFTSDDVQLAVYNSAGQRVKELAIRSTITVDVDLRDLPTGIYSVLGTQNSNVIFSNKVMINQP